MLVVGEQGKVSAQFYNGREFTILVKGLTDRIGSSGIYGEHVGILHDSPRDDLGHTHTTACTAPGATRNKRESETPPSGDQG